MLDILDTADKLRSQAQRCRWLARQTIDPEVIRVLVDLADELEQKAIELEDQS